MGVRARRERAVSTDAALEVIERVLADAGLTATFVSSGSERYPVHRCSLLDGRGELVAESLGKGAGRQSRASALFEAWQHLLHDRGQAGLPEDPRVRVLPIKRVVEQEALRGERMLARLADDFAQVNVACLPLSPLRGTGEVWFPAFARSPACRDHPVPGDDLQVYAPYLRYAYDNGTATGLDRDEAVLHALLEVVERDCLSHALLRWYLDDGSPLRAVPREGLPPDLRQLFDEVGERLGAPPLVVEITSDLGVPAFCALPSRPGGDPGVLGSGASLSAAYAVERALTELAQSAFNMGLGVDLTLQARLASLREWPLLERCARVDPGPLLDRLRFEASCEVEVVPERPVAGQVELLLDVLEAEGMRAWWFEWGPSRAECPVLTVVVPGMDHFSMVHSAVPVLPTGRAFSLLA
ncbi:YcaO-like family protein [Nonomuraea sp. NPDC050663]|uniref:YcaO-like family protein n=1 Tax=Nonomuraea sp. NPDC050663 TaxID=3364370 RepID=UPI0037BBBB30